MLVALLFFFWMRGKNSSVTSAHGEDLWVQLHALPEDHFSRTQILGLRKQEKVIQVSQHCPFMLATVLTASIPDAFAIALANREGITGAAVWQS